MSGLYRGRIPYVDEDNLVPYGRDDIRGLPIMVDDMVPVMQYMGSQIQWTGFYTHKDHVDVPQAQLAPAWLRPDPQPSPIIRILERSNTPPIPTNLVVDSVTENTITVHWDSVNVPASEGPITYVLQWTSSAMQNPIFDIAATTTATVPYTIMGLAPNTYYVLQIASTWPDVTSAYSFGISTTTLPI